MGITIQDGTYNATWEIAGFDIFGKRQAADGTVIDDGYGIALIPRTSLTNSQMYGTYNVMPAGYLGCAPMQNTLSAIQTKLEAVLGDHLVTRNLYLSNAANDNGSTGGKWTTGKLSLLSLTQLDGRNYGSVGSGYTIYDCGEANQKLPLFNHERYWLPYREWYWTRSLYKKFTYLNTIYAGAWDVSSDGSINGHHNVSDSSGVRPLIYVKA